MNGALLFLLDVALTIRTGDGDPENKSPVETIALTYPGV